MTKLLSSIRRSSLMLLVLVLVKYSFGFTDSSFGVAFPQLRLPPSVRTIRSDFASNHVRRRVRYPLSASMSETEGGKEGFDYDYDLAIIGAGPVGVRAAIVAASSPHYRSVCLIDAPRCSGALMGEKSDEDDEDEGDDEDSTSDNDPNDNEGDDAVNELDYDLSIGSPTGLFSKALRDTSKRLSVSTLRGMGLREDSIWNEITSSVLDLASTNAQDVRRQLDSAGVTLLEGFASFTGNGREIKVVRQRKGKGMGDDNNEEEEVSTNVTSRNILIATGSRPFRPSNIPFDGERIFDSDSINGITYLPKSIAITGSGIIAIEYAKIFRNLGAEVTLIIRDQVPRRALMKIGLDVDIAGSLVADLIRSGIVFERNAQVKEFVLPASSTLSRRRRGPIRILLEGKGGCERGGCGDELVVDAYLAAVGRIPNTDNLGLDKVGVKTDDYGGIVVTDGNRLETPSTVGNIFAAGDVLGRPFLASTGVAQGVMAVEAMFGSMTSSSSSHASASTASQTQPQQRKVDPKSLASDPFAFPVGVWSSPEAAYYGLTKQQALERLGEGAEVGEGMALYAECLRGQVFSPNGILKVVFQKNNIDENGGRRILGVHICGDDACELIHYGMELVRAQRTLEDVVNNVYSAVTFHEMYRIAAMAGLDEAAARKRRAAAGLALARRNRKVFGKSKDG